MSRLKSVRIGALPVVALSKSRRARVTRLFRELKAEAQLATPESAELLRCSLLLLLGEIHRASPSSLETQPQESSLASEALLYIQLHCLQPISLKDVAKAVHRTPAHVTTTVKKATGYTVGEWIRTGRIAEAAARLSHTSDSIDEIASHVGWQDRTHFTRQFRKIHGITPAVWRRENRVSSENSSDPNDEAKKL